MEPLRSPAFRRFMVAMLCFTAAIQIQVVAQGWLVFHITGSSLALAVVNSMWSITLLIFSPIGGVIADRVDRKLLLMLTWGLSGLSFVAIALLVFLGEIQVWHLALVSLLNGILFSFNFPARFAIITQMVSDAGLTSAMAVISIAFNLNGVIFSIMGGGLIDLVGADGAYLLVVLFYGVSVAIVGFLPYQLEESDTSRRGILKDLAEGVRIMRGNKVLMWLMGLSLAGVVLGQSYYVLLPGLAAETLQVPAYGLGLLMAMLALGGLVGNTVVANMGPNAPVGSWMLALGIASGAALIGLAFSGSLVLALVMLFLLGCAGLPFLTINQTLVQRLVPEDVRGRVLGLYMLTWAATPVGVISSSSLADRLGLPIPLILGGVGVGVATLLIAIACPSLLRLRKS